MPSFGSSPIHLSYRSLKNRGGPKGAPSEEDGAAGGDSVDTEEETYGVTGYRSIERWKFAAQPFLAAEDSIKMSIGVRNVINSGD